MEYEGVFDGLNLQSLRQGKFIKKSGGYIQLARIIFNGFSYNFGTQDGAVTINDNYTIWKFITPKDRWDLSHFAGKTLIETLQEIKADTDSTPIVAWDNFFNYLSDPQIEAYANMAIFNNTSSVKVAYCDTNLPIIQGVSTFSQFAAWIIENIGESGQLPATSFINGTDLIIPIDLYVGTPLRFNFKTPTMKPNAMGVVVTDTDGKTGLVRYDKADDVFDSPVLQIVVTDEQGEIDHNIIYAYEETKDSSGVTVPQGWSSTDGLTYTPFDIDSNPVNLEYVDGMQFTYLMKVFGDVEFESQTVDCYKIRDTIDLSAVADDFTASGSTFAFMVESIDNSQKMIAFMYSTDETNARIFVYVDTADSFNGAELTPGWNELFQNADETMTATPYDMAANPIIAAAINFETSDATSLLACVDYAGTTTVISEELNGTIYFMFRT